MFRMKRIAFSPLSFFSLNFEAGPYFSYPFAQAVWLRRSCQHVQVDITYTTLYITPVFGVSRPPVYFEYMSHHVCQFLHMLVNFRPVRPGGAGVISRGNRIWAILTHVRESSCRMSSNHVQRVLTYVLTYVT